MFQQVFWPSLKHKYDSVFYPLVALCFLAVFSLQPFRPRCYTYKFASKLVSLVPHVRAEARARKFPVEVGDEKDYFFEIGCVETFLGLAMSNYQQVTFSHLGFPTSLLRFPVFRFQVWLITAFLQKSCQQVCYKCSRPRLWFLISIISNIRMMSTRVL